MHPAAVLRAMQSRSVAAHLERMTAGAARAGVRALPAIVLPAPGGAQSGAGGRVLQGPDALADALAALAGEALR
jgi:hypothetical protein